MSLGMKARIEQRRQFRQKLRRREKMFGGWVSFDNPSITEIFGRAGFDFIAIDMEHSTISLEQAQRIIAASQSEGVPCLPRHVSHSNDYTKPLLDSGADGMLFQMVNTAEQVEKLVADVKYPPQGHRTYGVNRAQSYGFDFDDYVKSWNEASAVILQIESIVAVENIESLVAHDDVDGVMVGPYDMSGSLGVPGETNHPLVLEASRKVIAACEKFGKSCGTQVAQANSQSVANLFELGYTYAILGSDLFILQDWAANMQSLMLSERK